MQNLNIAGPNASQVWNVCAINRMDERKAGLSDQKWTISSLGQENGTILESSIRPLQSTKETNWSLFNVAI